jgi:hypothetical protein
MVRPAKEAPMAFEDLLAGDHRYRVRLNALSRAPFRTSTRQVLNEEGLDLGCILLHQTADHPLPREFRVR